ncbi:MAG: cytochrome c peroxidase [bacterium]
MMLSKKRIAIAAPMVVALLALSFPLSNLVCGPDNSGLLPARKDGVPRWSKVQPILAKKCVVCHSYKAKKPFYAGLPIAKGRMQKDVKAAQVWLDLPEELYRKGKIPLSEAALSKIEFALNDNTMPPRRYLLLHWNHGLSKAEKKELRAWIRDTRHRFFTTPGVARRHAGGALQPLPESVKVDAAKLALGERLYNDKRLSGDDTLSCASCHALDKGGTDRLRFSVGIKKQLGPINSPTVFNSGLQFVQFWDGRSPDLADQAGGPVENPLEMGSNWPQVITKLRQDEELLKAIEAIYGKNFTGKDLQDAIAEFEQTLITPSRFDRFLRGDAGALTAAEQKGYHLFTKKGCVMCHVGRTVGGQSFEKMGITRSYFEGKTLTDADRGRYNVTKRARDKHRFKVPMLRNIAVTAPYFHDGMTSDLAGAIQIMSKHQLENGLSKSEVAAVLAFLKSLTGAYKGKQLD